MPSVRSQLVFKALVVLDAALVEAETALVVPNAGLRFALAYLYAVGDRRGEWFDREPYDGFWRGATQGPFAPSDTSAGYGRLTAMRADFNAIARAAGMATTLKVMDVLRRARRE